MVFPNVKAIELLQLVLVYVCVYTYIYVWVLNVYEYFSTKKKKHCHNSRSDTQAFASIIFCHDQELKHLPALEKKVAR